MKQVKKICKKCQTYQYIFSNGECKRCASVRYNKLTSKITLNKVIKKSKLDTYFDYHIDLIKRSDESGFLIPHPTKANVCHILPKDRYVSVSDNLNNVLYLTIQEHAEFDTLLNNHEFDKLEKRFPKATKLMIERIKFIEEEIKENEKLLKGIRKYFKF